jgi:ligand-binding sensor domain-containing protein
MFLFARHKRRILFLILASLGGLVYASVPSFAERFPIKTYGTPDGLGSSFIECIAQDSRGFLWVCTRDGLSRFDGYKFTTYKTSDGLPVPDVSAILENEDGTFWVTTNGGGICKFDPAGKIRPNSRKKNGALFTTYSLGSSDYANRANIIYKDGDGTIYVGTDEGAFRLEKNGEGESFRQVVIHANVGGGKHQPVVNAILRDRSGNTWMSLVRDGLYRVFKDGRTRHYTTQDQIAFTRVLSLLEDSQGRLWVGTGQGLCLIEAHAETEKLSVRLYTKKDGLPNNGVSSLLQTRDGRLWIGTDDSLTEYDGVSFRSYGSKNGFVGTGIVKMFEDRDSNLWVGTQSGGLMKLSRRGFITYDVADAEGLTNIHTVFKDEAENFFVVSGNWFINQISSQGVTSFRLNVPAEAQMGWLTNALLRDHTGEFWATTDGLGVFRFPKVNDISRLAQTKPKAIYTTANGLANNYVRRAFEDSRGDIWFQSVGVTPKVVRWERATETFHQYAEADGFPAPTDLTEFYEDQTGTLFRLSNSNGNIYRYQDGRFTPLKESLAAQRGAITALFVDSHNRLWIADSKTGVSRIDNPLSDQPTRVKYGTAQGLSSENARCIAEDSWGRIYVGTVRGLDRIDTATGKVKHFSSADGLSSDFTKFIYRDDHDDLWIGTLNGISRFMPEPPSDTSPPAIVISGVRIAGEAYAINELGEDAIDNLELQSNRNQVQIDFTAPAFGLGETLRFQYKLEAADANWSAPTDLRTINYANLSPGNYRFLVQAINGEGILSVNPATVTFTILQPIWLRWWFVGLVAVLAGVILYSFYRYRMARLREVNAALAEAQRAEEALGQSRTERLAELERVRARIATDLHDDIGSSLTQIAILSEVAHQQAGASASENGSEPIARIISVSNELVDTMSDIVWAINPNRDHLSDLLHRMRRFASDVFTARHIAFQFRAPDPERDIELGANVRREVFLIFKESVNNVVKHSGCTRAEIEFQIEGDWLVLKVCDNGKGFDSKVTLDDSARVITSARGGNGVPSMRKRAEEMGGQFQIVSGIGEGTTATLRVLVAHQQAEMK